MKLNYTLQYISIVLIIISLVAEAANINQSKRPKKVSILLCKKSENMSFYQRMMHRLPLPGLLKIDKVKQKIYEIKEKMSDNVETNELAIKCFTSFFYF